MGFDERLDLLGVESGVFDDLDGLGVDFLWGDEENESIRGGTSSIWSMTGGVDRVEEGSREALIDVVGKLVDWFVGTSVFFPFLKLWIGWSSTAKGFGGVLNVCW